MTEWSTTPVAYLNLAELLERADDANPLLGRIRPVETSRGFVAVKADLGPTNTPVVQSLVYNEGVLTVDVRGCNLTGDIHSRADRGNPTFSCSLDELIPTWEEGVVSQDLLVRRTIIHSVLSTITQTGSAYDALHAGEPRIMPGTDEQYGPGYYLRRLIDEGERFPAAVIEAVLNIEEA